MTSKWLGLTLGANLRVFVFQLESVMHGMSLSPPDSHVEAPAANMMVLWVRTLRTMRFATKPWVLVIRFAPVCRERGAELPYFSMWGCSEKVAHCKSVKELMQGIEPTGFLIFNFPVSRAARNNCICNLRHFIHGILLWQLMVTKTKLMLCSLTACIDVETVFS